MKQRVEIVFKLGDGDTPDFSYIKNSTSVAALSCAKYKNNSSGCKGVSFCKHSKKWRAYIAFQRKPYHLGSFKDKKRAIQVRKNAEKIIYKPFIDQNGNLSEVEIGEMIKKLDNYIISLRK